MAMLMAAFRSTGSDVEHLVHRNSSLVRRFFRWTCPPPEQLWDVWAGVGASGGARNHTVRVQGSIRIEHRRNDERGPTLIPHSGTAARGARSA